MSPLQALAPDQRAILELLLRQGRTYAELSEMLGLPEAGVRTRAHGALAALAPDQPAPAGEDGAVADWILGQQDDAEAERTAGAIGGVPAWRAWAVAVTDRLAEVDGAAVPDVPGADAEPAAADDTTPRTAAARSRRPEAARAGGARRARPLRDGAAAAGAGAVAVDRRDDDGGSGGRRLPSSRVGGALLIGVLALLVAGGLFLIFSGGDDEQAASNANATATPTATPQVVNEIALEGVGNQAQGLMRVFRRPEDGRLVFALAADKLPPNKEREVYAVWFTKEGAPPRNLGFSQTRVGKEGVFTTAGPQESQEEDFARWLSDYDKVVVARASADTASAERPGEIVLQGTLPGGQQ